MTTIEDEIERNRKEVKLATQKLRKELEEIKNAR